MRLVFFVHFVTPRLIIEYDTDLSVVQRSHQSTVRVDDEDGHYIVVPDADLTQQCLFTASTLPLSDDILT